MGTGAYYNPRLLIFINIYFMRELISNINTLISTSLETHYF